LPWCGLRFCGLLSLLYYSSQPPLKQQFSEPRQSLTFYL